MSSFIARVIDIQSCDGLNVVQFACHSQTLSMMSLELDEKVVVGKKVRLLVKPTHLTIAKDFSGEVSSSNRLQTEIIAVENGTLLSSIKLKFFDVVLESVITLTSSMRMKLTVGESVIALIKASELSIGEVIDD